MSESIIRQAMSLLGKRTSDAKARAARENARKPRPNAKGKLKPRKTVS